MPTRILRDGILSSRAVNAVSEPAEILYRRLMSVVDDFGRAEADPDLLRAKCFPLQLERWPTERVREFLAELGESPLVTVYHRGEKSYIQIENFGQRLQSKERFPAPTPEEVATRAGSNSRSVADYKELRRTTENHGESPLNTKSESESKSYTKSESQQQQHVVNGNGAGNEKPLLLPPELKPQGEYPETLRVLLEHDRSADVLFCQRLADESARQIISDPVASKWTMEKQRKAVSDALLARACREVFRTPRKKPPGTGLLLVTVPRILIGGKLNYA